MGDEQRPVDRRAFFRRGLFEALKPLAKALEPVERAVGELDRLSAPKPAIEERRGSVKLQLYLRPPGAGTEKDFNAACQRCGDCVRACPAEAIRLVKEGTGPGEGGGLPFIDADLRACVACDDLACMTACPTGALVDTPLSLIKMGTAVWKEETCYRTTTGEPCVICVAVCPIGSAAIEVVDDAINIKPLGCIGCGLCQERCPTSPKSVVVIPKSAREGQVHQ